MNKIWTITLLAGLISCENTSKLPTDPTNINTEVNSEGEEIAPSETNAPIEFKDEIEFAKYCATQIEKGNIKELSAYTDGNILFSPYAHIDQKTARKVSLTELEANKKDVHFWGIQDGSGDSLLMTTPNYLKRYVLNFDIQDKKVELSASTQKPKVRGNELHNMQKLYPKATFVEFYHPPSKEGYLDWQAMIYVVEKVENQYILKAILHNQWTT